MDNRLENGGRGGEGGGGDVGGGAVLLTVGSVGPGSFLNYAIFIGG